MGDIFGSHLVNLFPEQPQLCHHQRVFALTAPGVQQLGKEVFQNGVLLLQLSAVGKLPYESAGRRWGNPGLDLCSGFLRTDGQLESAAFFPVKIWGFCAHRSLQRGVLTVYLLGHNREELEVTAEGAASASL